MTGGPMTDPGWATRTAPGGHYVPVTVSLSPLAWRTHLGRLWVPDDPRTRLPWLVEPWGRGLARSYWSASPRRIQTVCGARVQPTSRRYSIEVNRPTDLGSTACPACRRLVPLVAGGLAPWLDAALLAMTRLGELGGPEKGTSPALAWAAKLSGIPADQWRCAPETADHLTPKGATRIWVTPTDWKDDGA